MQTRTSTSSTRRQVLLVQSGVLHFAATAVELPHPSDPTNFAIAPSTPSTQQDAVAGCTAIRTSQANTVLGKGFSEQVEAMWLGDTHDMLSDW